ncbi:MAG: hypothetical protein ACI3W8_04525 [Oscillospiraceae bacterium]
MKQKILQKVQGNAEKQGRKHRENADYSENRFKSFEPASCELAEKGKEPCKKSGMAAGGAGKKGKGGAGFAPQSCKTL